MPTPYGYRILGAPCECRRLVMAADALAGYAACDARAELQVEAYLSAFQFGEDFRLQLEQTTSTSGFRGACWSPWIWFDIDCEGDLQAAASGARRLAASVVSRLMVDEDDLLIFFSGSKGFHIGIPSSLWLPEQSVSFNLVARRFCTGLAERAHVSIDESIYDKVRAFRAPNSRHPKTGLHKRRLSFGELMNLRVDGILTLAMEPAPFDLPSPVKTCSAAVADWNEAAKAVQTKTVAMAKHRKDRDGAPRLNQRTMQFIRKGADEGERNEQLFSAACNLAELGCSVALAEALLFEAALDSGLPPREVRKAIGNGISHGAQNA